MKYTSVWATTIEQLIRSNYQHAIISGMMEIANVTDELVNKSHSDLCVWTIPFKVIYLTTPQSY